jgi:hypothetical protein
MAGGLTVSRHSERSEESALICLGPELQILRFAQDDSDFDLHEWAVGICTPSAKVRLDRDFRNLEFTLYNLPFLFGGDRET